MSSEARYTCSACGKTWISNSERFEECPSCKTSCKPEKITVEEESSIRRKPLRITQEMIDDINRRYLGGQGCIKISMETQISVQTVIDTIKRGKGKDFKVIM